jgi:amino acid/amide ABC transporter substrate-binding protein, HAAT family (TC 3.A.1.4.-)
MIVLLKPKLLRNEANREMNKQNFLKNSWLRFIPVFLLIGILGFFLKGCIEKKPLPIGFTAQLTGIQAELGVQERNGVQLAVETINASGGVVGRKIELIIRDDLGIPEQAKAADSDLINAGVLAIIGHATSSQTLAGLEVTNPAHMVMLSPTVSTPKLSGLDDYFFRVYPSFKDSSQAFAQYIYQNSGIARMAIIYDIDNAAYSKTYSTTFTDKFQSVGGSHCLPQPGLTTKISKKHLPLLIKKGCRRESGPALALMWSNVTVLQRLWIIVMKRWMSNKSPFSSAYG